MPQGRHPSAARPRSLETSGGVDALTLREGREVRVDPELAGRLAQWSWRVLGGRIMAVEANRFRDLLWTVAGEAGWGCLRSGDCRRQALHRLLRPERPPPPTARGPWPMPPPDLPEAVPLGAVSFRPWGAAEARDNLAVDCLANSGSRLVLSHWANRETPPRYRRDLAAEAVFAYQAARRAELPSRVVTSDHYDADGVISIFALARPDLALRHRDRLVEAARYGDFRQTDDRDAVRLAAVCEALRRRVEAAAGPPTDVGGRDRVLAECVAATVAALPALLTDPRPWAPLWRAELAHLDATEAELACGGLRLVEEDPDLDLAVWQVARRCPETVPRPAGTPAYLGWSQAPLHARSPRLNLLLLSEAEAVLQQRYESWARLASRPEAARRDLSLLGMRLGRDSGATFDLAAAAPWELTPRLRFDPRRVSPAEVRARLGATPLGWLPHAEDLLPVYGGAG